MTHLDRWDAPVGDEFDKEVLRHLGLPEDHVPEDENEAYRLVIAALED